MPKRNLFNENLSIKKKALKALIGLTILAPAPAAAGQWCSPENANPWCGGAKPTNPKNELSCTPFNYRPWMSEGGGGRDHSYCKNNTMKRMAGDYFNTTKAWMYFNNDGSPESGNNKSYFVFHSCDGAGIMPDCAGDERYVERIYSKSNDQNNVWCQDNITLAQVPTSPYNSRRQCKFKHPGTGNIYKNYEAGVWGWGVNSVPWYMVASKANGGWGNNNEVSNMIIRNATNPFNKSDESVVVMATFPWVCTQAGSSDNQDGLFSNPRTPKTKCYYDNEPGKYQGHNGWPPVVNIYWMKLDNDGKQDYLTVYGYYLKNSSNGPNIERMNSGSPWRLYACNQGECPW